MPDRWAARMTKTNEVFRERIVVGRKKYGLVGFERHSGKDYLSIVSWEGGFVSSVQFELVAVDGLVSLIQHAMKHKSKPEERFCYSFTPPNTAVKATLRRKRNSKS